MRAVVVGASSGLGRSWPSAWASGGPRWPCWPGDRTVWPTRPRRPARSRWPSPVTSPTPGRVRPPSTEAAAGLGGIDALRLRPGIGPLGPARRHRPDTWRRTFDTNVIGAALVTAAAVPHLTASRGVAAYLSSVSASLTPPWPGLGSYAVSKAALETSWSRPTGLSTPVSASPGSSWVTAPAARVRR